MTLFTFDKSIQLELDPGVADEVAQMLSVGLLAALALKVFSGLKTIVSDTPVPSEWGFLGHSCFFPLYSLMSTDSSAIQLEKYKARKSCDLLQMKLQRAQDWTW